MQALIKDGTTLVATATQFTSPRIFDLTGIRTSATTGDIGGGYVVVPVADSYDHPLKDYQYYVVGPVTVADGSAFRQYTATDLDLDAVKSQQRTKLENRRDEWRAFFDVGPHHFPTDAWTLEMANGIDDGDTGALETLGGEWVDVDGTEVRAALAAHYRSIATEFVRHDKKRRGYKTVNGARAWDIDALWPAPVLPVGTR